MIDLIEQLKNISNVFYSEEYNVFYFTTYGTNIIAGDNAMNCVSGKEKDGKYTVTYTVEFSDILTDNVEYKTTFYIENGKYKFESNICIQMENTKKKAEQFKEQYKNAKVLTDKNGVVYAYYEVSPEEGDKYYINEGRELAYYKLLYVNADTIDYYFMNDGYIYFDKSESTRYYYKNAYPRGLSTSQFKKIQEDFAKCVRTVQ